jgi:hypothetical protein
MDKIFLIGRKRTGIGSIVKCLQILGFDEDSFLIEEEGDVQDIIINMKTKSICGVPYDYTMHDIRAIEKEYPSCRFIHTERNIDDWYSSFLRFYQGDENRSAYKNKGHYASEFYNKFNSDVTAHFKGKEWKILYIKYGYNSNWSIICSFVKKPIPKNVFPHENRLK